MHGFEFDLLGPRVPAVVVSPIVRRGADGLIDYDYTFKRPDEAGLEAPLGSARKMFLRARANSIEGGTSEIMRNILGERILGLPGEPRMDRDLPWSQVPRNPPAMSRSSSATPSSMASIARAAE